MGSGAMVQGWKADSEKEKCSCDFQGLAQHSQEGPGVPTEQTEFHRTIQPGKDRHESTL